MNSNNNINNTQIFKNTVFLYLRMFVLMAVSLFTSRITLDVLGVEDYGIYDVVGGVVVLFSFLSSALNTATQRFLSVELGKNNQVQYNKVYNSCIIIYILLAVIVVILAESIGLWFVSCKMNFPENRTEAAIFVYQFSVLTFVLNIIRTPFNASIIANEKMSFFAYTSIVEASLKLGLVLLLYYSIGFDKLKLYALLITVVSLILLVWYALFCVKRIEGCRIQRNYDKTLTRSIFSFSGWSLLGSAAVIGTNQGVNILLNIFWGVTVNAGMGIANQVSQVVNQFTTNFQLAFAPQITKSFSRGNVNYLNLIYRVSKLSFFLLYLISLPFLIYNDFFLGLWLKDVPDYAAQFSFWIIISMLLETLSAPLYLVVQAEGRIRNYQIIVSLLFFLNIILSYLFLSLGYQPIIVVIIRVIIAVLLLTFRIAYVSSIIGYRIVDYLVNVMIPIIKVLSISLSFTLLCKYLIFPQNTSVFIRFCNIAIILLMVFILSFCLGLKKDERKKIFKIFVDKVKIIKC